MDDRLSPCENSILSVEVGLNAHPVRKENKYIVNGVLRVMRAANLAHLPVKAVKDEIAMTSPLHLTVGLLNANVSFLS